MRPEEYALIVARRWWLPILAMIAASVAGFLYTSAQPTTYQTSSTLMAIAEPPDYWLDLYAKNRLSSYHNLISNWDFVTSALQEAGLDLDTEHTLRSLSLSHNADANTLHIIVTDSDPNRPAAVANALANAFVEQSKLDNERTAAVYRPTADSQPRGIVRIEKLTTPAPPTLPTKPPVQLNTAAAALLGLAFGILLTFAVEYLDDTLRTDQDVDRYLELPTLAGIPRV